MVLKIENDKQYEVTKYWAERFRKAAEVPYTHVEGVDPLLIKAEKEAYQSQYEELTKQIIEYEKTKV